MASKLENNKVALRYARALFDSVGEEIDAVYADLQQVAHSFALIQDLQMFMENPGIPMAEKLRIIDTQFDGLNSWVKRLIKMLIENGRLGALPMIINNVRELINRRDNVTQAEVVTAVELDRDLKDRIRLALEKNLGFNRIELETRVDPGILGGMIIKVQDRIIDGSYVGKLEDLRKQVARV
jgi:F-type H+-transporting ATPase subunit delta